MEKTKSEKGTLLIESDIAIPCGIAAYSYMSGIVWFTYRDNFVLQNST